MLERDHLHPVTHFSSVALLDRDTDQSCDDPQMPVVGVPVYPSSCASDQPMIDAQWADVAGATPLPSTNLLATPMPLPSAATHLPGTIVRPEPIFSASPATNVQAANERPSTTASARPADSYLMLAAEFVSDVEGLRIAAENRVRSMEQDGLGGAPENIRMVGHLESVRLLERDAIRELERAVKQHPLGDWIKGTVGVGLKQGGRLLAAIGDPAYNMTEDRPRRGPAELWAYCGFAPSQRLQRGVKANWNQEAKMRAFLIAESCIKHRHSPYRAAYDAARVKYEGSVHPTECKRCGPAGKPAQAGSPRSDGHCHAMALRVVAKAILRDLWKTASAL